VEASKSKIFRPISELFSGDKKSLWKQEEFVNRGKNIVSIDGSKISLNDFSKMINWGDFELSGAIGLDWVSISIGGQTESECLANHLFSWHYHPVGSPLFSLQDWLTFLMSDAVVSCVFTRDGVCVYSKEESQVRDKLVEQLLKKKESLSRRCPNLFFLQAIRLLENVIGGEIQTDRFEVELGKYLDVYCECG